MKLKITFEDQMATPMKNPLSFFIVLTFFLLSLGFLGFIRFFSSFLLTFTALIMSMLYFSISKTNPFPLHKSLHQQQEEEQKELTFLSSDHRNFSSASAPTVDLLSESECADDNFTTTEESEVEWPFFDRSTAKNIYRSDDGSISDEESLIEIALPTRHYVSHKSDDDDDDKDDMSFEFQKLKRKKNLVELLAEINDINEEENLIEIDISMGSIKYSRFEIEA
ncbi:uncharacterized protein LOC111777891 [Cucurbita pepo subsp. pepo]|uniref:uncharacterized protein LOC111777891 n=1 Tax=Cucurbita pepo subsp. pepo TaxID=3664 RepID=UPI000C9D7DF9|nr:uncharacterized protein LOC111777891 [Cucurbita pepo subsp. pepo]